MPVRPHAFAILIGVGALLGLVFASVSTYDFAMHLDRQVHDVHCSFVPGLSGPEAGESGCQVTMVSPYSSVFRGSVWGGIPISLPAMGVFGFLLAFAVELVVTGRQEDRKASGFMALATALPALTSLVMAFISLVELDAVCKLCIGIYVASAICVVGGVGLWLRARKIVVLEKPAPAGDPEAQPAADPAPRTDGQYLGAVFGIGVLFVLIPVLAYYLAAPDHARFIGTCGGLPEEDDPPATVPIDHHPDEPEVLEVLDPLCPACLGFEERLDASGLTGEMNRRALLFPLDNSCNWMVEQSVHPGACAISRAMLCAGDRARDVLHWAFAHQGRILEAAADDPEAASRMAKKKFPQLSSCIDSPEVKAKLNQSLRWAVRQRLPVMTPQLYVGDVKLCEEDVDIGLEFTLSRMLEREREGTLEAGQ